MYVTRFRQMLPKLRVRLHKTYGMATAPVPWLEIGYTDSIMHSIYTSTSPFDIGFYANLPIAPSMALVQSMAPTPLHQVSTVDF